MPIVAGFTGEEPRLSKVSARPVALFSLPPFPPASLLLSSLLPLPYPLVKKRQLPHRTTGAYPDPGCGTTGWDGMGGVCE
jgi:hypothetical protein